MSPEKLVKDLKMRFGADLEEVQGPPHVVVRITPQRLVEFARFLRDTPGYAFDFLIYVTAVDYKEYMEVCYAVRSLKEKHELMFKVKVPANNPEVPSLISVWPAADWDERETYDMFGIKFKGHPNLVRILMPDDWEGHPLLKSYPLNKRPSKMY